MSFEDDIKGQNTQLYPIVVIERGEESDGLTITPNYIFLSTNNVNIDLVSSDNGLISNPTVHCKPLLLNIPSIKESVDVESRKFKISNVSLDISNYEYEGERFTDILSETSLINTPVSIYFKSPSTTWVSSSEDIADNFKYNLCPLVYQGIIRRISHDDEKVKVELEDLTEKKAHKDLPQAIDQNGVVGVLGEGESISSKYRNKPIPMVYGHVDRSPVVFDGSVGMIESKDVIGIRTLVDDIFTKTLSGLMIESEKGLFTVPQIIETMNNSQFQYGGQLGEDESDEDISLLNSGEYQWEELSDNRFRLMSNNMEFLRGLQIEGVFPVEVNLWTFKDYIQITEDYDSLSNENKNVIYDKDIATYIEVLESQQRNVSEASPSSQQAQPCILKIHKLPIEGLDIVSDLKGSEFSINRIVMPQSSSTMFICGEDDIDGLSSSLEADFISPNSVGSNNIDISNIFEFNSSNNGDSDINVFAEYFNGATYGDSGGQAPYLKLWTYNEEHYYFQFKWIDKNQTTTSGIGGIDGKLKEVWGYSKFDIEKARDKSFYANVEGRINTFDDHPDISVRLQGSSDDELIQYLLDNWDNIVETAGWSEAQINNVLSLLSEYSADTLSVLEENQLITIAHLALGLAANISSYIHNPIDIIYDLVRSEIGHENIDVNEYEEAKAAHDGWQFAFTVNKKISSKKLIEEIAKSTKCFPKFKNDGSFGFNTVKDSYTLNGDYVNATPIKESEVISYSFKKTKPEQIYRKVTVSYNKDYAQDSYLKTAFSEDLGDDPYYGIEDSADAHLEFESDYIRHHSFNEPNQTADKLASFLLEQYKNDHLIFNLKLPLQYIDLEIGDLVKFESLFQGVKAYGIDYRVCEPVNGQYRYPLFMVTSTTKNLDSVSIECMQLHHLDHFTSEPEGAWNNLNNSFSDADTVTIEPYLFAVDVVTTEFQETDDSIETNNLFIYFHNSRPYLANINDTFDFEDYDGDTDEQNIFNGYVQIKNYTDSIIVKLAGIIFGASASNPDIFQRIQLGNPEGSFFPAAADVEGLSKFTKPEGWEEGDVLPTLEITRVTEVVSTPLSGAFDNQIKDLSNIKDIAIW